MRLGTRLETTFDEIAKAMHFDDASDCSRDWRLRRFY